MSPGLLKVRSGHSILYDTLLFFLLISYCCLVWCVTLFLIFSGASVLRDSMEELSRLASNILLGQLHISCLL